MAYTRSRILRCAIVVFGLGFLGAFASTTALSEEPAKVNFNRDVRPILSAKCFHCHGPDEKHREADLRLDVADSAHAVAIKPGKRDDSELWKRINADDEFTRMPPPESKKELTAEEIEILGRWIEQGAEYQGHWAFIPPDRPEVPVMEEMGANAIDGFIKKRLEKEGLDLSPRAKKELLLRRVTFDLTGLPPTLAEIDDFVADESPDAYEKVVDRLLASDHYGERMALAWMDAARYGDTSVYHADGPRDMWPWRDWVIRAYNQNKPFDEFTIEQLAGDLLPDPTVDQKVATGFHRNHGTTDEGGVIPEEYRVEYVVDRVATTGTVWLGLTLECAQCHDHKYDPISQKEYYQIYAFFNQSTDAGMQTRNGNAAPVVDVPDKQALAEAEKLRQVKEELAKKIADHIAKIEPDFQSWQQTAKPDESPQPPKDILAHWTLDELKDKQLPGEGTSESNEAPVGNIRGDVKVVDGKVGKAVEVGGNNFVDLGKVGSFERTDGFSYGCWIYFDKNGTGAPLARMDDGNAHRGWDIFFGQGNKIAVHIINTWPGNALKVNTEKALPAKQWNHVFVTYDGSSKSTGLKVYFNGEEQKHAPEVDSLSATIRTDTPLQIGRRSSGATFNGKVDDVRLYNRELSAIEVAAIAENNPLGELLSVPVAERSEQQVKSLRDYWLGQHDTEYVKLQKEMAGMDAKLANLTKPKVTSMVLQEMPKPRMTYVLERGHYASPKEDEVIQPNTPSFLPELASDNGEGNTSDRLDLARWIVSEQNPLTARVIVNRYWSMLFGQGLVTTPGDFGSQGAWPTHPELLDWLAVEFMESGWDTKHLLKLMVMSRTYQQTSAVTPKLAEVDPDNRLLGRGPRFRLQGEFIRDNALAAAGVLVPKVGGPGVKPYQPPGLWNEVSLNGNVRFKQDQGEALYRRSMYTYWKRSAPAPSMLIFDTPTREKCTVERPRTNTPLQALVTLNDPQFVEAARMLAERIMTEGGNSPKERVTLAYRLATGRQPTELAIKLLTSAYQRELATFQQQTSLANQLLAIGDMKRNENLDASEHAAWTVVTSMILNLDACMVRG